MSAISVPLTVAVLLVGCRVRPSGRIIINSEASMSGPKGRILGYALRTVIFYPPRFTGISPALNTYGS
jgi:hypothetical protein